MRVRRDHALLANRMLDDWLPPVLRDRRWFMAPLARLLLGGKAGIFLDFKERAFTLSPEEFAGVYRSIADVAGMQGETDLNERCTEAILAAVAGDSVLDIGCDIVIDGLSVPHVDFVAGSAEALPFPDGRFDTVVCTHTLEHVQQFAVAELRRRQAPDRRRAQAAAVPVHVQPAPAFLPVRLVADRGARCAAGRPADRSRRLALRRGRQPRLRCARSTSSMTGRLGGSGPK
jgi:hypothetical protein